MTTQNIFFALTALTTGLMAGLFFAFSYSVNPGLGNLSDAEYIGAMQSINRAIQNPVFFSVFFGAIILLPLTTYFHYSKINSKPFLFLLIAAIVYLIGVFGVTIFGNIPLNELLDKFNLHSASQEALTVQRTIFQERWNNLNAIRTFSSAVAFLLVVIAYAYDRAQ